MNISRDAAIVNLAFDCRSENNHRRGSPALGVDRRGSPAIGVDRRGSPAHGVELTFRSQEEPNSFFNFNGSIDPYFMLSKLFPMRQKDIGKILELATL